MVKSVNNKAFGNMIYDDHWGKNEVVTVFGEELELEIVAVSFDGEGILPIQEKKYLEFKEGIEEFFVRAIDALDDYCDENAEDIIDALFEEHGDSYEPPEDPLELMEFTAILFSQNGDIAILAECEWDTEDGIAIVFDTEGNIIIDDQALII